MRMIDNVVNVLCGEVEKLSAKVLLLKNHMPIVVLSNKCSTQIGEVSLRLCGEIC